MLFTEPRFLPFFLVVFAVHWALRSNGWRKAWLLGCSYAFYAAWDWRFCGLILTSTLVDYVVGLRLARPTRRRKAWLLVSLVANLGILGFFKYYDFFVESAVRLLEVLGLEPHVSTLRLILPVGISFYTFQTLSYTIDVYRGRLQPVRSFLDLATFVGFFPQLVAGPIVRASYFLPQLREKRLLARVDVRGALVLFLIGFVKKACISDNLGPDVDRYFADPLSYDAWSCWVATLYFAVQVYCDFSGYSDMAIACAALLGYRLPLNFDFPYFARNATEIWRRWHISLSTWMRDYLYVPLGGNRGTHLFNYRNLMVTMLLGGLWHGAGWNFVGWGGLHGLGLVVHREWMRRVPEGRWNRRAVGWIAPVLTFYFFCACLVVFRSPTLVGADASLRAFLLFQSTGSASLGDGFIPVFLGLAAVHWVSYRGWFSGWWVRMPGWAFAGVYGVLAALVMPFVSVSFTPFIYFQF